MTDSIAGVELGGTKCVCVLGRPDGTMVETRRVPTEDPQRTLGAIEAILDEWAVSPGFSRLGIASFGPVDLDVASATWGHVLSTPKPGWSGTDIARRLGARYDVPTGFDTDVNGAALAEGLWGACIDVTDYVYITVGTGVGAGIIVGGKPVIGFGHAELGHIRVARARHDDWPGWCPYHGDCVEGLIAGPALRLRTGRDPALLEPTDPVWHDVVNVLAQTLHTAVLTSSPRRILLGGGVMTAQPHLFPRLRSALVASLAGYVALPDFERRIDGYVTAPALGDRAGPAGALAVALSA